MTASFLCLCGFKVFTVNLGQVAALLMHFANGIIRFDKSLEELFLNISCSLDVNGSVHASADDGDARDRTDHVPEVIVPDLFAVFFADDIEHEQPLAHQLLAQFIDASAGNESAFDKDADAIGNALNLIQVMRGDHDGDAVFVGKLPD